MTPSAPAPGPSTASAPATGAAAARHPRRAADGAPAGPARTSRAGPPATLPAGDGPAPVRLTWVQPEDLVGHELRQAAEDGRNAGEIAARWYA
ncbi:hypothetical protein ABZ615_34050, partial [Streptomyces sp. NPDC007325]